MLSKCQDIPIGIQNILIDNNEKFVPKIFNKKKFVLHYENLHLYLRLGLKLKNIYCVLELNQLEWLKCNTKKE